MYSHFLHVCCEIFEVKHWNTNERCNYASLDSLKGFVLTSVKSGNFGHQVNLDSDLVCFIFY